MYEVRIKKYESRKWKTLEKFDTERQAKKYAIKLDMQYRKSIETMYDSIEVKYPDGTKYKIA